MKKLLPLIVIAVVALMFVVTAYEGGMAGEKPKGQKMSSSSTFDYTITSTATKRDTTSDMWKMSGLGNFGSIKGIIECGLYSVSISTVDTTKDTVIVEIWTGVDGGGYSDVKVWTETFVVIDSFGETSACEQTFDISDSTVFDYIYFQVITNVNDATPVDSTATYKVTQATWAKP